MKVYVRLAHGHRMLNYSYGNSHAKFCFHLLCEVGEPWQAEAKLALTELCEKTKSTVKTVELDQRPWYVDTLVRIKETP